MKNYTSIVPRHEEGKIIDTESSETFSTVEEAKSFYQHARARLMDVNNWHQICGTLSAKFQLVDAAGNEVQRPVQKQDYFKIDIPGPGPSSGHGYDWVEVEEIREVSVDDVESIGIRVRPTSSPVNDGEDVSHFYSPDATSSFIVTREGNTVTVSVYDRNTKPNEEATGADLLRDKAIGAGAVTIFSKLQWKALVKGILERK